jgi:hypothetical protein
MTFSNPRAAANRHHKALLARHAAQWINFRFVRIHLLFLLFVSLMF